MGFTIVRYNNMENALRYFAPDDIAEAFAATHGVTLPGQLAQELKERKRLDGTDLIETFRSLAPPCLLAAPPLVP